MRDRCQKQVPGAGFCSYRHRDEFLRMNKLTRPQRLPENLRVEIQRHGSPWKRAYEELIHKRRVAPQPPPAPRKHVDAEPAQGTH